MAKVIAGMAVSVDGFVADHKGNTGQLSDPAALRGSTYMNELIDDTGAVVMGKRSYSMAADPDWYVGNYEFQTPIFVLTHEPPAVPPKQDDSLTFTFVTDGIASAISQARAAAGDRLVQVLGVDVIRQALLARVVDELHLDVVPILLGAGLRLFDDPDLEGINLRRVEVREIGALTSLQFKVV